MNWCCWWLCLLSINIFLLSLWIPLTSMPCEGLRWSGLVVCYLWSVNNPKRTFAGSWSRWCFRTAMHVEKQQPNKRREQWWTQGTITKDQVNYFIFLIYFLVLFFFYFMTMWSTESASCMKVCLAYPLLFEGCWLINVSLRLNLCGFIKTYFQSHFVPQHSQHFLLLSYFAAEEPTEPRGPLFGFYFFHLGLLKKVVFQHRKGLLAHLILQRQ